MIKPPIAESNPMSRGLSYSSSATYNFKHATNASSFRVQFTILSEPDHSYSVVQTPSFKNRPTTVTLKPLKNRSHHCVTLYLPTHNTASATRGGMPVPKAELPPTPSHLDQVSRPTEMTFNTIPVAFPAGSRTSLHAYAVYIF